MSRSKETPSPKSARSSVRTADKMLIGLLAALVIVWFATIPLRRRLAQETARYNRQAQKAQAEQVQARQIQQAVHNLKAQVEQAGQAVAIAPNDAAKRLQYGSMLDASNRSAEAETQFQAAVDLVPNAAEPRAVLGEFYDHQNKLDLAIDNYKKALALDPRNVRALKGLAFRYVSLGWNQQAEALLQRAVNEQPREVRLHISLGLAAFQIDNMKRAERELLEARRLAPNDPTIYLPLIEVYRLAHRPADALKTIEQAEPFVQDKVQLLTEKALVYIQTNDQERLFAVLSDIIRLDPDNVRAHYLRGLTLRRKGSIGEATQEFEWVYRHQPDFEQTKLMLGQLWIQQGRTEEGKRLIEEITHTSNQAAVRSRLMLNVGLKPNSADTHARLGANYLNTGQYPRAIVELKRALELRPTDIASRLLLIKALEAAGRGPEANDLRSR